MRTINISTDAYAAIWAARQPGEETENQILERILEVSREGDNQVRAVEALSRGFSDPRFGIELPEGFEIFRIFKGKEFRAQARDGKWELIGTDQSFPSLNQLSRGVGAGVENAWQNWYYKRSDGKRVLVSALRKEAL